MDSPKIELTRQLVQEICIFLVGGIDIEHALKACRIPQETYDDWLDTAKACDNKSIITLPERMCVLLVDEMNKCDELSDEQQKEIEVQTRQIRQDLITQKILDKFMELEQELSSIEYSEDYDSDYQIKNREFQYVYNQMTTKDG